MHIVKAKKVHTQIKILARFLIVKKKFIEIKTNLDINSPRRDNGEKVNDKECYQV